jgi:hypothetical protein
MFIVLPDGGAGRPIAVLYTGGGPWDRITVELILEKLAAGETVDQIFSEHPRLTAEGIRAAIAFAAEVLQADVVYPVETVAG